MRYNKTFKNGIITILLCCVLFGVIFTISVIARIQYNEITQNMLTTNATITEIKIDHHSSKYGGYDQEMQIVYEVDEQTYNRELATDTKNAFQAGYRTNFSVGDVVEIYYNPENPLEIATELSDKHARNMMIFSGMSLAFMVAIFITGIITRKRFLITEEEYKKEKDAKKKTKSVYKNAEGYKIRVQYFNYFLFFEFCGFLMVLTMLIMNTILDGVGTKIESPAEIISMFWVFAVLTSPIWILSLVNRRFFGKIVCVVNDEGIIYRNKTIRWEDIEEIKYQIVLPSGSSNRDKESSYARIIGSNLDIKINRAPSMLLGKAKKQNKNIKAALSKSSILVLTMMPLAFIVLAVIILLV